MTAWRLRPLLLLAAAFLVAPAALRAQSAGPRDVARTVALTAPVGGRAALAYDRGPFVERAVERSRARGARKGAIIGVVFGVVAGLALTNDFLDDPGVNVMIGAASFGLLGALVGAAVGG